MLFVSSSELCLQIFLLFNCVMLILTFVTWLYCFLVSVFTVILYCISFSMSQIESASVNFWTRTLVLCFTCFSSPLLFILVIDEKVLACEFWLLLGSSSNRTSGVSSMIYALKTLLWAYCGWNFTWISRQHASRALFCEFF